MHTDLLRSDANYPWLVTLTKILLVFPTLSLSLSGFEAAGGKIHFNFFFAVFMHRKEHGIFELSEDKNLNILWMR